MTCQFWLYNVDDDGLDDCPPTEWSSLLASAMAAVEWRASPIETEFDVIEVIPIESYGRHEIPASSAVIRPNSSVRSP